MLKITRLLPIFACFLLMHISNNAQVNTIYNNQINSSETNLKLFDFNISPNPAKGNINIEFTKNMSGIIRIHDNLGNQVLEVDINDTLNQNISLEELNSGIYFVSVKTTEKTIIKRLIKY